MGDSQSDAQGFGGHCIVIGNGIGHVYGTSLPLPYLSFCYSLCSIISVLIIRIGVEFTKMGQKGVLARYPFHFHFMGDQIGKGHFVHENSFHHNYQRCLTVHGTSVSTSLPLFHIYLFFSPLYRSTFLTVCNRVSPCKITWVITLRAIATFWKRYLCFPSLYIYIYIYIIYIYIYIYILYLLFFYNLYSLFKKGSETYNTFNHNLGMVVNAGPMIFSDQSPSIFWITNPVCHPLSPLFLSALS